MTGGNLQNASGSAYIFEKNLYGIWNQEQKIVAFDRCQADWFGFSVSISGNYAISGAVHEDNDVLYSNFMNNSGSAYIYRSCKTNSVITPTTCNQYVSPSGNYVWSNSGIYIDTIPNALGCDSIITVNLTINSNTSDTTTVSACYNYISPSGNYNWNKSGIYNDTIQNSSGCDSLITIYLTIDTVDVSVTQTGITLTANSSNATYQWLDCYNGSSIIPGANNQSYTPDSIGVYAVEITKNGCIDTSSCIVVIGIGIIENDLSHSLNIYPNPTSCELIVEVKNIEKLEIMSINGKSILCFNTKKDRLNIDLSTYKKGIYFIKVTTIDHVFVRKVEVN